MRLRVCTFGGEGACSGGAGERTLDALRLLSPPSCAAVGCSCLARCDRGVALQIEGSGEVVDEVNGGEACAALLRRLGMRVDEQLLKALALSERGDAQLEAGRPEAAVAAYRRAFSLATSAGLAPEPYDVVRLPRASRRLGDRGERPRNTSARHV